MPERTFNMRSRLLHLLFCAGLLITSGCGPLFDIRKAMYDQPKYEPLEATDFFGDRRSARPLIEDTVSQGNLRLDDLLYFYGVIMIGFGQMMSYSHQIPVEDRWRIIAYIKTLQRSQFADVEDLDAIQEFIQEASPEPSSPEHANEHH
jgi:hypothetical protein